MDKLSSLTMFTPFYNDAGTVSATIESCYKYGQMVTDDLEVIALHGGNSKDTTHEEIIKMRDKYPSLRIIDKRDNWELARKGSSFSLITWAQLRSKSETSLSLYLPLQGKSFVCNGMRLYIAFTNQFDIKQSKKLLIYKHLNI